MTAYCQPSDVYRFVAPGLLQVPARLISAVVGNVLTLQGHGLSTDDPLSVRAESGGSLPTPLVAGTTYYAISLSPDTFEFAAAPGGAAITLGGTPSNVMLVPQMHWDGWIAECSAMLDQTVTAHTVPLLNPDGSTPEPVRLYTAALLAVRALAFCGRETQAVQEQLEFWSKKTNDWARGVPLRGVQVPTSANLSITRSARQVDPRGWDRGRGLP